MEILQQLLNVPTEVYVTLLGYLFGAAGVTIFTQVAKKWFSIDNGASVLILLTSLSFVASGIEYLMSASDLPVAILGVSTVSIIGIATQLYHWVLKPSIAAITIYKAGRAAIVSKAEAIAKQPLTPVSPPAPVEVPTTLQPVSRPRDTVDF